MQDRQPIAPPALVIFDCDGVIVDSEPVANDILRDAMAAFGLPMTLQQVIDRYVGTSMDTIMKDMAVRAGRPVPPEWVDDLKAATFAAFRRDLRPVAGVGAAVDAIQRAGIATCIASSGSHDKMDLTLGLTGMAGRFAGRIFSASEVANGKPAPDLFLHAAARMGVRPGACVVVEDSRPGAEAARAAGMRCLGLAQRGQDAALAGAGAVVFTGMEALPGLLGL